MKLSMLLLLFLFFLAKHKATSQGEKTSGIQLSVRWNNYIITILSMNVIKKNFEMAKESWLRDAKQFLKNSFQSCFLYFHSGV